VDVRHTGPLLGHARLGWTRHDVLCLQRDYSVRWLRIVGCHRPYCVPVESYPDRHPCLVSECCLPYRPILSRGDRRFVPLNLNSRLKFVRRPRPLHLCKSAGKFVPDNMAYVDCFVDGLPLCYCLPRGTRACTYAHVNLRTHCLRQVQARRTQQTYLSLDARTHIHARLLTRARMSTQWELNIKALNAIRNVRL